MESSAGADPEPGALDLPLDAHLHTDLSHDADVPIDVYAAEARRRGVREIAITDHLDFDPRDPNHALGDHRNRERIVREAAARWDGSPEIRFGVEITYERRLEGQIRDYLGTHAYDYVIGSVHLSDRQPLGRPGADTWARAEGFRGASAWYWEEVEGLVRSGLFHTLGHLDVIRRWLHPILGAMDPAEHADLYERVLRSLVDTGVALEINSSGLRHAHGEMYPPPGVVRRFSELGGERIVAGSDAHRAHHFAFGLPQAYAAIEAVRITRLTFGDSERPTAVLA